jgi:hypothetical protein
VRIISSPFGLICLNVAAPLLRLSSMRVALLSRRLFSRSTPNGVRSDQDLKCRSCVTTANIGSLSYQ